MPVMVLAKIQTAFTKNFKTHLRYATAQTIKFSLRLAF